MHEMLNTAKLLSDYKSATLQVAKIAKEIRKEIFACEHFKFAFHKLTRVQWNLSYQVF